MSAREAIVAEARSWIGTPYRHGAALKGSGCDCLGLVRGVWRGVFGARAGGGRGLWPAGRRERRGDAGDGGAAASSTRSGRGVRRGDILLFRWRLTCRRGTWRFVGIGGADGSRAERGRSAKCRSARWWRRRLAYAFRAAGRVGQRKPASAAVPRRFAAAASSRPSPTRGEGERGAAAARHPLPLVGSGRGWGRRVSAGSAAEFQRDGMTLMATLVFRPPAPRSGRCSGRSAPWSGGPSGRWPATRSTRRCSARERDAGGPGAAARRPRGAGSTRARRSRASMGGCGWPAR